VIAGRKKDENMKMRLSSRLTCALSLSQLVACSAGSEPAKAGAEVADDSGTKPTTPPKPPAVRTSCGDVPIFGDFDRSVPDACKACVEEKCCAEAESCAANADCSAIRNCFGTCETDEECAACNEMTAAPENGAFIRCRDACRACLDLESCVTSPPATPTEASYPMTTKIQSYTGAGIVFPGVTVKVCERSDADCVAPLSQGVTADDGTVHLDFPGSADFSATYLEITGPNVMPTRSFLKFAQARAMLEGGTLTLGLLDSATGDALRGVLGTTQDQTSVGLLSVFPRTCQNRGVAGVTAESSAADVHTIRQYQAGAAPSVDATATDVTGVAVFGDHPAGPTSVAVKDTISGVVIGTAELVVRPGFMNSVVVLPAPR